jgi:hypothetical protein
MGGFYLFFCVGFHELTQFFSLQLYIYSFSLAVE